MIKCLELTLAIFSLLSPAETHPRSGTDNRKNLPRVAPPWGCRSEDGVASLTIPHGKTINQGKKTKKPRRNEVFLVGHPGFEPGTSCLPKHQVFALLLVQHPAKCRSFVRRKPIQERNGIIERRTVPIPHFPLGHPKMRGDIGVASSLVGRRFVLKSVIRGRRGRALNAFESRWG